jgi:V/A-type H+-transporting ATPase subunit D
VRSRASPTRSALLRTQRLRDRVDRGASLLRRKREALVRALFPLARPAVEARREIEELADGAYRAQLEAMATEGADAVTATAWPPRELSAELDVAPVWGVPVPHLSALPSFERGLAARATAPGIGGPALFEASNRFETLADKVLVAASRELHLRALGAALSRTSRQVHALEYRVAPRLRDEIAQIRAALDEREREEQTRLRQLRKKRDRR